jgi:DNA uptake protein ComE-like DNA-binding protein
MATSAHARSGMALLVVVVLVMLISLAAYRYSFEMENEYRLTRLQEEQAQARLAALSGVEFASSFLEQPLRVRQTILKSGASEKFFGRPLRAPTQDPSKESDSQSHWRFAIISDAGASEQSTAQIGLSSNNSAASNSSAATANPGSLAGNSEFNRSWQWGLENEGGKLHIPTLLRWNQTRPGIARSMLLRLPDADEETVDTWLAQFGVRTAATIARDTIASASSSGLQSPSQRQQKAQANDLVRLRWFGGDLDQNYQIDPWESSLLEKLLIDPNATMTGNPMLRELSRNNATASTPSNPNTMGSMSTSSIDDLGGNATTGSGAWKQYLSWVQGERNERPDGTQKIILNQPDLRKLHQELTQVLTVSQANFIIAMRQHGPGIDTRSLQGNNSNRNRPQGTNSPSTSSNQSTAARNSPPAADSNASSQNQSSKNASRSSTTSPATPSPTTPSAQSRRGATSQASSGTNESVQTERVTPEQWVPNWQQPALYQLRSPLELIDVELDLSPVGNSTSNRGQNKMMSSPWANSNPESRSAMLKLMEHTTVQTQPIIEGRVDLTVASAVVLSAIPGIDPALAQKIVQTRQEGAMRGPEEEIRSIAWLLEKGLVDVRKLVELEPFLTTRSDVFSLQSVGFRDEKSPVFRCTVVIDARQIPAQIRDLQVWHPWDRGFPAESLQPGVP